MTYKRSLILTIIITTALILASCGTQELEDPLNWEIGTLQGTTQANEEFSIDDMEGKVWLADFIFTSCNTVCPPMTRNMAKIQDMLEEEGVDAEIVSFSVDPEVDTPKMLKEFGSAQGADFSNWTFVTGYSQDKIESFAKESFKTIAQKTEGVKQVSHGSQFFLVNQEGKVVKYYKGATNVPFEQIVEDAKIVAN
ncbi:SCO family protein [Halobacillus amylolyticus]|uniref:SCO family protein n=1 Tax=Halobacillus amylolyticus TaxID=2932259 RepID=A0ABY4H6X0_9BACI|nr:SCO family protein [Halobacillus amylolyticus]UOR10427.1 SCO family protein [Halobacillus amylolyticus]